MQAYNNFNLVDFLLEKFQSKTLSNILEHSDFNKYFYKGKVIIAIFTLISELKANYEQIIKAVGGLDENGKPVKAPKKITAKLSALLDENNKLYNTCLTYINKLRSGKNISKVILPSKKGGKNYDAGLVDEESLQDSNYFFHSISSVIDNMSELTDKNFINVNEQILDDAKISIDSLLEEDKNSSFPFGVYVYYANSSFWPDVVKGQPILIFSLNIQNGAVDHYLGREELWNYSGLKNFKVIYNLLGFDPVLVKYYENTEFIIRDNSGRGDSDGNFFDYASNTYIDLPVKENIKKCIDLIDFFYDNKPKSLFNSINILEKKIYKPNYEKGVYLKDDPRNFILLYTTSILSEEINVSTLKQGLLNIEKYNKSVFNVGDKLEYIRQKQNDTDTDPSSLYRKQKPLKVKSPSEYFGFYRIKKDYMPFFNLVPKDFVLSPKIPFTQPEETDRYNNSEKSINIQEVIRTIFGIKNFNIIKCLNDGDKIEFLSNSGSPNYLPNSQIDNNYVLGSDKKFNRFADSQDVVNPYINGNVNKPLRGERKDRQSAYYEPMNVDSQFNNVDPKTGVKNKNVYNRYQPYNKDYAQSIDTYSLYKDDDKSNLFYPNDNKNKDSKKQTTNEWNSIYKQVKHLDRVKKILLNFYLDSSKKVKYNDPQSKYYINFKQVVSKIQELIDALNNANIDVYEYSVLTDKIKDLNLHVANFVGGLNELYELIANPQSLHDARNFMNYNIDSMTAKNMKSAYDSIIQQRSSIIQEMNSLIDEINKKDKKDSDTSELKESLKYKKNVKNKTKSLLESFDDLDAFSDELDRLEGEEYEKGLEDSTRPYSDVYVNPLFSNAFFSPSTVQEFYENMYELVQYTLKNNSSTLDLNEISLKNITECIKFDELFKALLYVPSVGSQNEKYTQGISTWTLSPAFWKNIMNPTDDLNEHKNIKNIIGFERWVDYKYLPLIFDFRGMFTNCAFLESISGLDYFLNAAGTKSHVYANDYSFMFAGCRSLKEVGTFLHRGFELDNKLIRDVKNMFAGCESLTTNIDFTKCIFIENMLSNKTDNIRSLKENVLDFSNLFFDCKNLSYVGFKDCRVDYRGFLKTNIDTNSMFRNCKPNLTIDVTGSKNFENIIKNSVKGLSTYSYLDLDSVNLIH